uniref:Uncharacterized protein n=1 Tax=Aegilops tauschii subsp. strangulata TaxID=200361 RepID=A0A453SA67_AEGTS
FLISKPTQQTLEQPTGHRADPNARRGIGPLFSRVPFCFNQEAKGGRYGGAGELVVDVEGAGRRRHGGVPAPA